METRDRRSEAPAGQNVARLIVLIDELADIMLTVPEAALTRLLQRGREAGIHIIAATQRPSAAILSGLMRANFPLRRVGYVVSAKDARIASGRPGAIAGHPRWQWRPSPLHCRHLAFSPPHPICSFPTQTPHA